MADHSFSLLDAMSSEELLDLQELARSVQPQQCASHAQVSPSAPRIMRPDQFDDQQTSILLIQPDLIESSYTVAKPVHTLVKNASNEQNAQQQTQHHMTTHGDSNNTDRSPGNISIERRVILTLRPGDHDATVPDPVLNWHHSSPDAREEQILPAVAELKTIMLELKSEAYEIRRWMAKLQAEMRSIRSISEKVQVDMGKMQSGFNTLQSKVGDVASSVAEQSSKIASVEKKMATPVGSAVPHPGNAEGAGSGRWGEDAGVMRKKRTGGFTGW